MKIEWLNAGRTRARVTRGWFRKRFADVYGEPGSYWRYEANGEQVSSWLDRELDSARNRARRIEPWQPVERMPVARLVERKP